MLLAAVEIFQSHIVVQEFTITFFSLLFILYHRFTTRNFADIAFKHDALIPRWYDGLNGLNGETPNIHFE